MKSLSVIFILLTLNVSASQTRTFSCSGTYENSDGKPFSSIHDELIYTELENSSDLELFGEDSLFTMKGFLEIRGNKEFLNIELTSKKTGMVLYNDNSRLGQLGNDHFNFVFLGLKNISPIDTSNGNTFVAAKGSFQCQTYRN